MLEGLKILSVRNSSIEIKFNFARNLRNLTQIDLRHNLHGAAAILNQSQMHLTEYNCTYPTPLLCIRRED